MGRKKKKKKSNYSPVFQDAEGVLVANIGSYMGGVDLWQNEDENYDNFDPQSMHDKILEVVVISGTWHLGKLQVKMKFDPNPCSNNRLYIWNSVHAVDKGSRT